MSKNPLFRSVAARFARYTDGNLLDSWKNLALTAKERNNFREALWVRLWDAAEPRVRHALRKCKGGCTEERMEEVLSRLMRDADTILGNWQPERAKLVTRTRDWIKGALGDALRDEGFVHLPEQVHAGLKKIPSLSKGVESCTAELVRAHKLGTGRIGELEANRKQLLGEQEALARLPLHRVDKKGGEDGSDPVLHLTCDRFGRACDVVATLTLAEVLAGCPAKHRQAWELAESGYSFHEAGERIGVSKVTAAKYCRQVDAWITALAA